MCIKAYNHILRMKCRAAVSAVVQRVRKILSCRTPHYPLLQNVWEVILNHDKVANAHGVRNERRG